MPGGPENPAAFAETSEFSPELQEVEGYLEGIENGFTKYRLMRARLLHVIDGFATQARGSGLEEYARRLPEDFEANVDRYMLRLFRTLDVRGNSEVRMKLFEGRNPIPGLRFFSEEDERKSAEFLGFSVNGWYNEEQHIVYLVDFPQMRANYNNFRHVFMHEFTHGWIGRTGRERHQRILNEGTTDFISFRVTGHSFSHDKARNLAEAIYELDSDMLVDWYLDHDDERLHGRLVRSLGRFHGSQEAEEIAQQVVDVQDEVNKISEAESLVVWAEGHRDKPENFDQLPIQEQREYVDRLLEVKEERIKIAVDEFWTELVAKLQER